MAADPDPNADHLTVKPVNVREDTGRAEQIIRIAVVLLVLAVFKPWAWGAAPAPASSASRAPLAPTLPTPRPTADLTAEGIAAPFCLGSGSWRTAELETWRTQKVRVWRTFDPVTGALDAAAASIPGVSVVAYQVDALGWCAPAGQPDRPAGPLDVTIWRVVGTHAAPFDVRRVVPVDAAPILGALYAPAGDLAGAGWTSGRYVFEIRDIGRVRTSWFAVEVVILPPESPPPPPASGPPG